MTIKKVELITTLKRLQKAKACVSGMIILMKSLNKTEIDNKPINLLHILKSNGIDHFFWAWRATTKPEKKVKRMILHDIVALVEPVYLNKYPESTLFKQVLKGLRTGRRLKDADCATVDAAAASAAANAAASSAASAAAYADAYGAYYAASAASYAAAYDAAANAVKTSYYAAAYGASHAVKAAYYAAFNDDYAANCSSKAADYAAAKVAKQQMLKKQIAIIKKYLK